MSRLGDDGQGPNWSLFWTVAVGAALGAVVAVLEIVFNIRVPIP